MQTLGSPKNVQFRRDILLIVTADSIVRDANATCLEKLGASILGPSLIEDERMKGFGGDVRDLFS